MFWPQELPIFRLEGPGVSVPSGTATSAIPARADGEPWEYALFTHQAGRGVFTVGNGAHDAFASPQGGWIQTPDQQIVLNIRGYDHWAQVIATDALACPVSRQGGYTTMNPPQLDTTSGIVSTTSASSQALPTPTDGPNRNYMFTFLGSTPVSIAVGDSTVDATTDPQFSMTQDSGPVVINCSGLTHFAWSAAASGSLYVTALGD